MPLLSEEIIGQLKLALTALSQPVKVLVFTQEMECQFCRENRMLMEEVTAAAPDKLRLEAYNFVLDRPMVEKYRIDRIPAIVVEGTRDYGIRFYGIPAGYEFASLVEDLKVVSRGDPGLLPSTIDRLQRITRPVRIQVFVTLTCPYCSTQVHLAHRLAMASPFITAEMIESAEFPLLANRYSVLAVPKTVVDGALQIEGAMPEEYFVDRLMEFLDHPQAVATPPLIIAPGGQRSAG